MEPTKCTYVRLQYDTTEEFNVDSKAERGQPYLAHVARNKKSIKKKLKQTKASSVKVNVREGSPEMFTSALVLSPTVRKNGEKQ